MTTISERLRAAPWNKPQIYADREEAADAIDALVAALEAASADLEAVGRTDTFEQIDAALALARKGGE